MPMPDTYWGIQLPDGYIPVDGDTATQVISALEAGTPTLRVVSLIGSIRYIVMSKVIEVFQSTPEQRDNNRDFERRLDEETKLFKELNRDWNSDD